MTSNRELLEIRENEIPRGVGIQTAIFADRAKNAEIWDVEGNRYIDLGTGIAVVMMVLCLLISVIAQRVNQTLQPENAS